MGKLHGLQCSRSHIRLIDDLKLTDINAKFCSDRLDLRLITYKDRICNSLLLCSLHGLQYSGILCCSDSNFFHSAALHLSNYLVETLFHLLFLLPNRAFSLLFFARGHHISQTNTNR